MSLYTVVPVLGRTAALAATLAAIRDRAGADLHVCVVVDGDPAIGWHAVAANQRLARHLADTTAVLGAHCGNGAAVQAGAILVGANRPWVKHDADVIGSPGWATRLLADAARWDDGALGVLAALPDSALPRWAVGPRVLGGRRMLLRIALFTPRGATAITDHTTAVPINGHDVLVLRQLRAAGLWAAYTNHAWIAGHDDDTSAEAVAYRAWRAAYRWTRT